MPDAASSYIANNKMKLQTLRRFLVLWASRIVLKTAITSNGSLKNKFRETKRTFMELIETESHASIIQWMLPYIYIYIYKYCSPLIFILLDPFNDLIIFPLIFEIIPKICPNHLQTHKRSTHLKSFRWSLLIWK